MDLQKRVECLERENRWIKRIGAVAILLCGIATSLGFQAAQDATTQFKERRAQLRQKMVQFNPIGEDIKIIMEKLVENAKNGDVHSAEMILETIYRSTDD